MQLFSTKISQYTSFSIIYGPQSQKFSVVLIHCKYSALSFITILDLYFPLEMSEVLKSLEQVVYRWFDLGLQLGLSDGVLHAIEHDYQRIGDRKREMVSKWMTSAALNPTWCSLAKALHAIELHAVAEEISVEHCK